MSPELLRKAAGQSLGVLVPEAELSLQGGKAEAVVLPAAADSALVGRCAVPAVAVLEHARVPGQAQAEAADTRFPSVIHLPAAGCQQGLRGLGQGLEDGAIYTCKDKKQGHQPSRTLGQEMRRSEALGSVLGARD